MTAYSVAAALGNYAQKPPAVVYFVSGFGNDSNDGKSWGTAFRTINKALTTLTTPGIIYVGGGDYTEAVTITRNGIHLVGVSETTAFAGAVARVKPVTTSSTCISVTASNVCIENIWTAGTTSFTGIGLDMNGANHSRVINWRHQNDDGAHTVSTGGTGLRIQNSEGCLFEKPYVQEANLAYSFVNEASCNTFIDVRAAQNWQDLLIAGNCGGNTFVHMKTVNSGNPLASSEVITLGGVGENVFLYPDWCEAGANSATISSDRNVLIGGCLAPNTTMTVSGSANFFLGYRSNGGAITVSGNHNVLATARLLGSVTFSGSNNVWEDPTTASSVTGTYLQRLHTGLPASASSAVGTLSRKIEVFDRTGTSLGFVPVYSSIT
jgi:hypothetical protein